MARPIWTGTVSFGLVTVPVGVYAATEDHSLHFRQLQRGTSDRVRNLRVNERTGKEVEYGDIVKGYEVAEGEYVVIEPAELDGISPGRSKTIEINGFVELEKVDPIFFDKTYYLGPRGKEYAKVYALLQRALAETGRAGVANFAMRGKQYLAAVRAEGDLLVLQTMHYADEVRDPRREVDNLPEQAEPRAQELAAARQLIEALSVDWDPDAYHDTYADQVRALVEAKLNGEETVTAGPTPESTNVVDLMDMLQRSLSQAGAAGVAAEPEAEPADLAGLTKAELYRMATEQGVHGRSTMSRDELQQALEAAGKPGRRLRAVS
ncbi:non-homologous end joining protein Ku [Kitasatospora sp. McL0602]|uniref:non-homologous end joining protein Ku n=1 Tax=Kitasatospora sp. McL0602 TaxID=3439530 RepID=UPI003F8AAAEE